MFQLETDYEAIQENGEEVFRVLRPITIRSIVKVKACRTRQCGAS